jgi:CheY-like chemotaxis protein
MKVPADDTARLLETVGQLAGGIAHDFSNLLTAILGHVEMLSDDLAPGDPRAADVTGIRHAAERAANLTQQLLAFSRKQILQPAVLDLNQIVQRTQGMVQRMAGAGIEVVTLAPLDLWRVHADAAQIEQLLLNLAVNARDAMPDGGCLTLQTQNVALDETAAASRGVPAGNYVQLTVADTGCGIDAATCPHIFEPFFTTKGRARAAGLGLATVYGIVTQSGGHIVVDSEPGRGSRFEVYLPATTGHVAPVEAPEQATARANRGSETVLVVEDDATVRTLIGNVLRRRGYQLLAAPNAAQAMKLAGEHTRPIHLLIADATTPAGSAAMADAIRASRPETRVLYLHKPFRPDALARKVRAALGGR